MRDRVGGTAAAQVCPNDDIFESNALPQLPIGATNGLTLGTGVGDEDNWEYLIGPGDAVVMDILFSHASGNIDAALVTESWSLIAASQSTTDNEQFTYTNSTSLPVVLILVVGHSLAPIPSCQEYSLLVTPTLHACSIATEDPHEPNDDCAQAIPLAPGLHTDLVVFKGTSDDFWTVSVQDGESLSVWVLHSTSNGQDVDCYLYDSSTLGSTCGDKATFLERGFTATDNEEMSWTNDTGSTRIYYVQVNVWDNVSVPNCGEYDLSITVQPAGLLGTPLCFGDGSSGACPCGNESAVGAGEGCESSLGVGSILTANGTLSVAADDLAFTVTQARPNQPGMLVQGALLMQVPFKDGVLCTGNPTERIGVVFTDAAGSGTTAASIATEGSVAPGDIRWYQMWSRDPGGVSPCGAGSNFSNGMQVTFTP